MINCREPLVVVVVKLGLLDSPSAFIAKIRAQTNIEDVNSVIMVTTKNKLKQDTLIIRETPQSTPKGWKCSK